mgnify:CR=1 FL=1
MVGQTPERLQDHEVAAAALGVLEDLRRNQHALARIERMVQDLIARAHELGHARRRLVERARRAQAVATVVRELEQVVRVAYQAFSGSDRSTWNSRDCACL